MICNRETLLPALHAVSRVCGKSLKSCGGISILENVLFVFKDGTLTLTGTDLEVEVTERIKAEGDDMSFTLNGGRIMAICRALPKGAEIEFSGDLEVKSGRSRFSLQTLPYEDFPIICLPEDESVIYDSKKLLECINNVAFCASSKDVRYYLNGVLFDFSDEFTVVATDGHRLAKSVLGKSAISQKLIIPNKGVAEIIRLLKDSKEVTLTFDKKQLTVASETSQVNTKLLEGLYPEYAKAIPDITSTFSVDRLDFLNILQRVEVLTFEKHRGVQLSIKDNLLTASSSNSEGEDAVDCIEVEYPDCDAAFNITYLIDVLKAIKDDNAEVQINETCCLLDPGTGNCDSIWVVMPMRI